MVIETNQSGIYLHFAYAEDDQGTGFSLTEFDGAVYVGNYISRSATESTNWYEYTWQVIGADEIPEEDIDEDLSEGEPVEIAGLEADIDDLEADQDDIVARTINNDENIQGSQFAQDEGLGNVNLLSGTNQGTTNWTSSTATLSAVTTPIYTEDVNDAVNTLHAVMTGSDTLTFDASTFIEFIGANNEENVYTLSYDLKVSNENAVIGVSVPGVITFDSPSFETTEDEDIEGTWNHYISTAELTAEASADFVLTYTGSAGDTIDLANLKIEAGAMATPWRASLEEIEGIANTALSTATTAGVQAEEALTAATETSQHFWYDTSGAHVTEITQEEYIADPTAAGGNTLITSAGMDIRNGNTVVASFTERGAQVGSVSAQRVVITPNETAFYDAQSSVVLDITQGNQGLKTITERIAPTTEFKETPYTLTTSAIKYTPNGDVIISFDYETDYSYLDLPALTVIHKDFTFSGSGTQTDGDFTVTYDASTQRATIVFNGTLGTYSVNGFGGYTTSGSLKSGKTLTATFLYPPITGQSLTQKASLISGPDFDMVVGTSKTQTKDGYTFTYTGGNSFTIKNNGTSLIDGSFWGASYTTPGARFTNVYAQYQVTAYKSIMSFGSRTSGYGGYSLTAGNELIGDYDNQTVIGEFNSSFDGPLVIGNGSDDQRRSNALTVDWSGNVEAAGQITVGSDPTANLEVATKQYVDNSGTTDTTLNSGTMTSSSASKTLTGSLADYKYVLFMCTIGNFRSELILPVSVFQESTSVYHVVTVRNGATDTRYGFFRYNSDTSVSVYSTVNNGLNYQIRGLV